MYICESCGKQSEPNEPAHKVVVETRVKHYPEGTVGEEIVKELTCCEQCFDRYHL